MFGGHAVVPGHAIPRAHYSRGGPRLWPQTRVHGSSSLGLAFTDFTSEHVIVLNSSFFQNCLFVCIRVTLGMHMPKKVGKPSRKPVKKEDEKSQLPINDRPRRQMKRKISENEDSEGQLISKANSKLFI